MHAVVVKGLFE